jgi:hypothetical protein
MDERPIVIKAIELTSRTAEKRLMQYRMLVIATCTSGVGCILAASFFHQWALLGGLIFLVPLIAGFSYLDSLRVRSWRKQISGMQRNQGLDLDLFLQTAANLERFSPALRSMLSTVRIPQEDKDRYDKQQRNLERMTLVAALLATLALVLFVGAAFYKSLVLLVSGSLVGVLFVLQQRFSAQIREDPRIRQGAEQSTAISNPKKNGP